MYTAAGHVLTINGANKTAFVRMDGLDLAVLTEEDGRRRLDAKKGDKPTVMVSGHIPDSSGNTQSATIEAASGEFSAGATRLGLPDPHCHTGVLSLADGTGPQACCAGYCGECTDYSTCASVRGQNSTFACCKSRVLERECGKGAPAKVCLKQCSEAVPPCIMATKRWGGNL